MAEEGLVIACHDAQTWQKHFDQGCSSQKLVVVDFTASWCGPCRFIAPIMDELAKKLPDVKFLKVDVDELKPVSEHWGVNAMPTFVFLKEGKEVDRLVGAKKDDLQCKVEKHMASASASASA